MCTRNDSLPKSRAQEILLILRYQTCSMQSMLWVASSLLQNWNRAQLEKIISLQSGNSNTASGQATSRFVEALQKAARVKSKSGELSKISAYVSRNSSVLSWPSWWWTGGSEAGEGERKDSGTDLWQCEWKVSKTRVRYRILKVVDAQHS